MTNSKLLIGDVTLNKSAEYMTHVQVTDTHLNDGSDGALLGMNTECLVGQVINSAVGDESLLIIGYEPYSRRGWMSKRFQTRLLR